IAYLGGCGGGELGIRKERKKYISGFVKTINNKINLFEFVNCSDGIAFWRMPKCVTVRSPSS
ncbi:MAG: hypothetical protein RR248_04495, partial [Clostridia bacterium]